MKLMMEVILKLSVVGIIMILYSKLEMIFIKEK